MIDILHDLIEVDIVGVCKSQNNLDDTWELFLEDFFDEFAGGALWDRLCGFSILLQLLILGNHIRNIGVFLPLPGHIVLQEVLDKLSKPEECLTFRGVQSYHIILCGF